MVLQSMVQFLEEAIALDNLSLKRSRTLDDKRVLTSLRVRKLDGRRWKRIGECNRQLSGQNHTDEGIPRHPTEGFSHAINPVP